MFFFHKKTKTNKYVKTKRRQTCLLFFRELSIIQTTYSREPDPARLVSTPAVNQTKHMQHNGSHKLTATVTQTKQEKLLHELKVTKPTVNRSTEASHPSSLLWRSNERSYSKSNARDIWFDVFLPSQRACKLSSKPQITAPLAHCRTKFTNHNDKTSATDRQ